MNFVAKQSIGISKDSIDLGQFYEAIFDSELAIYIVCFDDKGLARFEDANDTVAGIAGRPRTQILGQRPIDCLPAEVGECLETQLQTCFEDGEILVYERSLDLPSGRIAFRTRLIPIADEHGKVGHIVGMTRDITNEVDLVDEAQQNAALLQRLGITLPSAIYLLNVQALTIRFIGGDLDPDRQQWRGKAEAAGSLAATKFIHPDEQAKAEAHLEHLKALADAEVITIDYRILSASGEYRHHSNRETVFSRTATGEVELVLGVSEDISDRDRAQKEVLDLSERLLTMQLDERRRIAEDLHDSTGQHLFAAGLALVRARSTQPAKATYKGQALLMDALDDARHSLQVAQREIRMLSYLLHPPEIMSEGLGEAVTNFARGFAKRSGLVVETRISPETPEIGDDLSLNLFRACQEGLTNIYRHADASMATIVLDTDRSGVRLEVTDDGIGVDPAQSLGVGLSGMRERMKRLGGDVELIGGPAGTTLLVTVPTPPS